MSVDLVASDAILKLNALYTSEGTLLRLDRSGTNRMVQKSFTVPVMVERGIVALPPSLSSDRTVGTRLRYEEENYSGLIVFVLNLSVSQFSFVTLVW